MGCRPMVSGWGIGEKWGKYRQWVARRLLALLDLFTSERASVNGAPTEPGGVTESLWSPRGTVLALVCFGLWTSSTRPERASSERRTGKARRQGSGTQVRRVSSVESITRTAAEWPVSPSYAFRHTLGPPRDHHARPVIRREIDTAADRRGPAPSQAGLGEQRAQYNLHLV